MTLSLIKSPAAVSLAGNDILFKINTDNRYSSVGSNSLLTLLFSDIDTTPGNKFKLEWGNFEKEFTLVATPDGSGLQLPAATSGQDLAEWVEMLADALKSNYDLSEEFLVEYVSGPAPDESIYISSIEKGSDKSLTFTNDPINPVQNISEDANTAGTDPIGRDFYQLLCRVWLAGSSGDTLLGEDRLTPDADGNCSFKIQEYLKPEVSFSFQWPEGYDTFIFQNTGIIILFFVEYAETYDGEVKRLYSTENTVTYAFLGGIDRNRQADLNEQDKPFLDQLIYRKDFLTWQPREMIINQYQPVKLSFLVWDENQTTLKLKIKVFFTDGTDTTVTKTISCTQYEVFECILSYQKLGMGSYVKTVSYYEIWIDDQDNTRKSVSRYFYIDYNYYEDERIFIFQNSLGCADVIRFTGITETNVELERTSAEKINQEGFTWQDFDIQDFDNMEVQRFSFNTGWLNNLSSRPKQLADYLREFYLSPKIYELVNNRLYPVRIITKKQFITKTDETLSYIEFEAERAYTDQYFSQDENIHPSTGWEAKFESEEFLNPQ